MPGTPAKLPPVNVIFCGELVNQVEKALVDDNQCLYFTQKIQSKNGEAIDGVFREKMAECINSEGSVMCWVQGDRTVLLWAL